MSFLGFEKDGDLNQSVPVYVTRPHGRDQVTGQYSISLWLPLLTMFLIFFNAIGWGIYGLVNLVGNLIEAVL